MPSNLKNSTVATGLEQVSFHSSPKEGQCQRMFILVHNCSHVTCQQSNAQNSPSEASTVLKPRTGRSSSWIYEWQRNRDQITNILWIIASQGFPHSSVGKESTCNAGDPNLIPGSGRFPGEGIGYGLQYSWASLVDQLVKNPPAMRETWVQSLGQEDPLEKGKATHSSILAYRITGAVQSMVSQRVGPTERL